MKHFLTPLLFLFSFLGLSQVPDSYINVNILTDNYPGETTWELKETDEVGTTTTIYTGGPYVQANTLFTDSLVLTSAYDYEFIIYDSYGDGICCFYGAGIVSLTNECQGVIWVDEFQGSVNGGEQNTFQLSFSFNVEPCGLEPPVWGCTDSMALNYVPEATFDDGSCEYPPCEGVASFEVIQDACSGYPPLAIWEVLPGMNCNPIIINWATDTDDLGNNPYPIDGLSQFYIPYTIAFQTYYVQLEFADGEVSDVYSFTKDPCIQGCLDPLATNFNPFAEVGNPALCEYEITGCPEGEVLVSIELSLDQYPGETWWELSNQDSIILGGGPYPEEVYSLIEESLCVTEGDTLTFTLYDAFGDGFAGSIWGGLDGSAVVTLDCGATQDTIFATTDPNYGTVATSLPYATQGCEAFAIAGCTNPGYVEYNPLATIVVPEDCITPVVLGCTDEDYYNFCDTCNQQEIIPTCDYTLILTDGAGDGWFGSYIGLIQNGETIGPFSLATGFEEDFTIELSAMSPVDVIFVTIGNSETTADQCGFTLIGPEGNITAQGGTNVWTDEIKPFPYRYRGIPYCGNTCIEFAYGCLDNNAVNFDSLANTDDGSCYYTPGCLNPGYVEYYIQGFEPDFEPEGACQTFAVFGCTDVDAFNYNPEANVDNEGCVPKILGCTNPLAFNYNANANTDDGTCESIKEGCTDPTAFNYDPEANTDDGSCVEVVFGCTDNSAFNFDPLANTDNGSCVPKVLGCTDETALNYNPDANIEDGSCIEILYGCTDSTALNYNELANVDNGSCIAIVEGCTNPNALNYNAEANVDDLSCILPIYGCTNPEALNYNNVANVDNGSCIPVIEGCTNPIALNYDANANTDNFSCILPVYGCTDSTAFNYNELANVDNGTCIPVVEGCTDPTALNYDSTANTDDFSCILPIYGCTDSEAFNYNELANVDNGSCIGVILGCTNPIALNYNAEANTDDLSCVLPIYGCTDSTAFNYNELANVDNGSCIPVIEGCTDPNAFNYNPEANTEDFSCEEFVYGCTDPEALNYDPEANTDNDSCIDIIEGCMDQNAWNYDPLANVDSGGCLYNAGCVGGPGEPYWLNDGCFAWVIDVSPNCCTSEWNGGCQSLYDYCYDNNETVGIEEYGETNIVVFPNPTKDILTIASNLNVNAILYNSLGQPILQENNVSQIDMSKFEGGVYNLILSYENIQFTKKIIKQ